MHRAPVLSGSPAEKKESESEMKKLLCLLLALMVWIPCVSLADQNYIIKDSNTRELTEAELWEYQYDTLKYAFNEIFARHGYKFETGSPCYNWFIRQPWYTPNENESSTDHHATYSQCSQLEMNNVNLIKKVRADMRAQKTLNPGGKGMPEAPDSPDSPRGFSYVELKADQLLKVYTAPSAASYRANNGKASCSTNGAVYAMGYDSGWMLILYEASAANQFRVGYVDTGSIKGKLPDLPVLTWENEKCRVESTADVTDDPARTGKTLTTVTEGSYVTYLTTMYNSTAWDYIETTIDGLPARGFIPAGCLDLSDADADEE